MAMIEYNEIRDRIQRKFGERYRADPTIFNIAGHSLACKIDEHYYFAVHAALIKLLSRWCAILPDKVGQTLVKTGDLITSPDRRDPVISLKAHWPEPGSHVRRPRSARLEACLLHSSFVDKGLMLYGGADAPLPVSQLRIDASEREKLEAFLEGKTALESLAYQ